MAALGLLWLLPNPEMTLAHMMVQYPGGSRSELRPDVLQRTNKLLSRNESGPVEGILQAVLRLNETGRNH